MLRHVEETLMCDDFTEKLCANGRKVVSEYLSDGEFGQMSE